MNRFGKISIISAGLVLPLTILTSKSVDWYLKSTNSDGIDITYALAYLRPTLLTAIACFSVLWLISLIAGLLGNKRDSSNQLSKIGLILLALVTVISFSAGFVSKKTSDAESNYQRNSTILQ